MSLYCSDETAYQRLWVPVSIHAASYCEDSGSEAVSLHDPGLPSSHQMWDLQLALWHAMFSALKSENSVCPAYCRAQHKANYTGFVMCFAN